MNAVVIFLALTLMLTGCASTKRPKKVQTNQSTVFEVSRSAVYEMLKHFRSCYAKFGSNKDFIILFRTEISVADEAGLLKSFDVSTVNPDDTEIKVCTGEARKIGVERLQKEWTQAKAVLTLGEHTVVSDGEIHPKARYNTTDLHTGVTEVGY